MSRWPDAPEADWATIFESRKFLESSWPEVYTGLKGLAENPQTRPDFILADYLVDAARDVSREYDIPLAMHWPQMPTAMLPAPHIPGTPGLQVDVLTSEFATFWQRLRNALLIYTSLPWYLSYLSWRRQMRKSMGVSHPLKAQHKPDYLCLVNSFFALEAAKDLPPNVAAIGPVLSDEFPRLNEPFVSFLSSRSAVLYISLGTHALLSHDILVRLISGALSALDSGLIDGIIWSIRPMAKRQLRLAESVEWTLLSDQSSSSVSVTAILNNKVPSLLVTDLAPQRAILEDPRTVAFISHCGSSSTNEATFAGTPIIALPVYFDQLQYAMRLRDAGVAIHLQKDSFQAADVAKAIATIVSDRENQGPISANVHRVMRIARISARRKHLAADLVEEVLVDWEGRIPPYAITFGPDSNCTLEICDVRYSVYGFVPSLAANTSFLILFILAGIAHTYLGWIWKTSLFAGFMLVGCLSAIVGYIGRLLLNANPFSFEGFMIQIIGVTLAPVYFCAAIYITLAKTIEELAPRLSRIPPRYFYYILIPCDLISLVVQGAGGVLSTSSSGRSQIGVNLALAGLAFQVFTIVVFCGFFIDFLQITPRIKIFFGFLAFSVLLITIRCVFRLAELHQGYSGHLVRDEPLYIAFEGAIHLQEERLSKAQQLESSSSRDHVRTHRQHPEAYMKESLGHGRVDLVVPAREAVELRMRQEVELQQRAREVRVRLARGDGDQRGERRGEVGDY
ncbi:hypothetical protein DV738_g102, partial [Chaetothyriales sp. CBS 135597]